MILEAVRAMSDALGNGSTGVAARLSSLTYDGSDTAPAGPTIIDETQSDDAALNRGDAPYIRVIANDVRSLIGQAAQYIHEAEVPLELTIVRAATSPAAVVRDLYYTLRATLQCIDAAFAAAVTRNNVQVYVITDLSAAQVRPSLEDNTGTVTLLVTLRCRDLLA